LISSVRKEKQMGKGTGWQVLRKSEFFSLDLL
jgi:hypothetical protein